MTITNNLARTDVRVGNKETGMSFSGWEFNNAICQCGNLGKTDVSVGIFQEKMSGF